MATRRLSKQEQDYLSATRGLAAALRRQGREEGLKEGLLKGLVEGREEGHEQGRKEALRSTLQTVYRARFGDLPTRVARAIESVDDAERLSALVAFFATADQEEIANQIKLPGRSRRTRA